MVRAHIGLGSNLGERLNVMGAALVRIDELVDTTVIAVSRVYESEPWPDPDHPPFANAVAVIETGLAPDVLLGMLKEIERECGRTSGLANAPRALDLDILLMEDEEWVSAELTIPHPRMLERDFVIAPLLEVDPFAALPDGTPVGADEVRHGRVTGVLGVVPGFEAVTRDIEHVQRDGEPAWTEVATAGGTGRGEGYPAAGAALMFERSVLDAEGIEYAWDPYPPERWSNPYGIKPRFRLLVPASLGDKARLVLAEAAAAPPEIGDV